MRCGEGQRRRWPQARHASAPRFMAALSTKRRRTGWGRPRTSRQVGVAAHERDRCRAPRTRHGHALLRSVRGDVRHNQIQPYPDTYNYNDEQWRFGQVARQWNLVTPRSKKWKALLEHAQSAPRDAGSDDGRLPGGTRRRASRNGRMARRIHAPLAHRFLHAEPHAITARTFSTGRRGTRSRGTTSIRVWIMLLNDYKNMGGRVTTESRMRASSTTPTASRRRGDGDAAGGGFPPARGDPSGDDACGARRCLADRKADRNRRR